MALLAAVRPKLPVPPRGRSWRPRGPSGPGGTGTGRPEAVALALVGVAISLPILVCTLFLPGGGCRLRRRRGRLGALCCPPEESRRTEGPGPPGLSTATAGPTRIITHARREQAEQGYLAHRPAAPAAALLLCDVF